MIFNQKEERKILIFYCPVCQSNFCIFGETYHGCLVNHPAGTCCHFNETTISEEKVKKIEAIIKEDSK